MENPIKWVPLLKTIYSGQTVECPYCGSQTVSHQFFAENHIGCAQFKCNSCGKEGHLSRVTFPENVKTEKIY